MLKKLIEGYSMEYRSDLGLITGIDSGTGDTEGSARIAEFLKKKIEDLGGEIEQRANDKGTYVIGRFKGDGNLKLLLVGHTDTVFKKGEAIKRPFKIDARNRATGPGVLDDKATVLQMVYLVKIFQDMNYKGFGEITLYFSAEEETGSAFADGILAELSPRANVCFIMDTAKAEWGVVTRRKGRANYTMKVFGVESHAGTPYRGVNAIHELTHQVAMILALESPQPHDPATLTPAALKERGIVDHGQFIPENTITFGIIGTSNDRVNVVPKEAWAEFEVRFFETAEWERLDAEIKRIAETSRIRGASVSVTGGINAWPMESNDRVREMINLYREIVTHEYDAEVVEYSSGGVTDGNFSARFVPTLDSLGIEGFGSHSEREFADLDSFVPRTVALVQLIRALADRSNTAFGT